MLAFFPILETPLKGSFWHHRFCCDFSFVSSIETKRFPFIGVFSFRKRKKSAGTNYNLIEKIWIVFNISWAMSMRRCFCSKFSSFWTIFTAARIMSKTSVKIASHEPNDVPISCVSWGDIMVQNPWLVFSQFGAIVWIASRNRLITSR